MPRLCRPGDPPPPFCHCPLPPRTSPVGQTPSAALQPTFNSEDNQRLLKTIDAVTEKFGKNMLQVGASRKTGK